MNLYGAVAVACSAEAAGLGVLVVSNDRIHTAREATKAHPQALDAFVSPDTGPLGWARPPTFLHRPVRGAARAIELDAIDALPQVEILTVAAGSSPRLLNACIGTGARGIILALPGNSSLPQSWEAALAAARAARCSVLVASRTGADPLALTPLKARVRLITTLLDEGMKGRHSGRQAARGCRFLHEFTYPPLDSLNTLFLLAFDRWHGSC